MSVSQPLSRTVGQTERALQALITTQLAPAGLSFAEWAALTLIHGAERPTRDQLSAALASGHIVGREEVAALIDTLIDRGLVESAGGALSLTDAGKAFYRPLRTAIGNLTEKLVAGIAPDDIDTTRRTLDLVARRAGELAAGR